MWQCRGGSLPHCCCGVRHYRGGMAAQVAGASHGMVCCRAAAWCAGPGRCKRHGYAGPLLWHSLFQWNTVDCSGLGCCDNRDTGTSSCVPQPPSAVFTPLCHQCRKCHMKHMMAAGGAAVHGTSGGLGFDAPPAAARAACKCNSGPLFLLYRPVLLTCQHVGWRRLGQAAGLLPAPVCCVCVVWSL